MNKQGKKMIDPSAEVLKKISIVLFPYIEKLSNLLYKRTIPVLTYRKLLDDIVVFKPEDAEVKSCAVVKEMKPNGEFKINVVYLDKDNNPIWKDGKNQECSFALAARKIDQELTDTFGNQNIIIFN